MWPQVLPRSDGRAVAAALSLNMTSQGLLRVSGLAFLILFAGGSAVWWPWGEVRAGADPGAIAQFYADTRALIVIGGTLSVLGIAAFVVFASAVRELIEDPVVGTAATVGAGVLAVAGFGAETINMAGSIRATDDPQLAQTLYEIPQVLGGYTSAIGAGIFALAVAAAGLLSRRAAASVAAIGLVLLTPLAAFVTEVAGGGALLVVAAVLIGVPRDTQRARHGGPQSTGPEGRSV